MKTILSWDVGIKNLAYCLIKKTSDVDFEILKWGVINLMTDEETKCEYVLRGGGICQDTAKYCVYHRDKIPIFGNKTGTMLVCSRHKEKSIPVVKNLLEEAKKTKVKTKSKQSDLNKNTDKSQNNDLKCCHDCDEEVTHVLGDSANCWCKNHWEKKGEQFIKKIHAKKVTTTTCSKQPIQSLAEKLFEILDNKMSDFCCASEVLIENQPTLKNPKMKTLSSILYSYFVLRGINDKNKTNSQIEIVRFVSPSNKLKVNSNITNSLIKKEKEKEDSSNKNVYKLTKSLGVKYCMALINEKDLKSLNEVKKKDDMCDAFLQGFQYLFSPIPELHFKKLEIVGFDTDKIKKTKVTKTIKTTTEKISDESVQLATSTTEDIDIKPKKSTKSTKK